MEYESTIKILDGGSGFEAIELCKGKIELAGHKCWSSKLLYDNQDLVRQIYRRFLTVGCEVITSLSYQANPFNLSSSFNISIEEAEGLVTDSVLLAKEEVGRLQVNNKSALVAASIGPFGAHLADGSEYSGSYIDSVAILEVTDMYRYIIQVLLKSDPDLLAFETIPTIEEVKIIIDLMREHPNTKAWISMSTFDGLTTAHGDPLLDVVDLVNTTGNNIFAFGINCSTNLLAIKSTVRDIRKRLSATKTIVLYPNNGQQFDLTTKEWHFPEGIDNRTFYDLLPSWIDEGARWVGGCCKMGSEEMGQVAKIINGIRTKEMSQ